MTPGDLPGLLDYCAITGIIALIGLLVFEVIERDLF